MTTVPLLETLKLSKQFTVGSRFSAHGLLTVHAVDAVSLAIMVGMVVNENTLIRVVN